MDSLIRRLNLSTRMARAILWGSTLLLPSLWIIDVRFGINQVIASLWLVTFGGYFDCFFLFFRYLEGVVYTLPSYIMIGYIVLTSPLILSAAVLELFAEGYGQPKISRFFVLLTPVGYPLLSLMVWTSGIYTLYLPIPAASVIQYIRYRQLCLVYESKKLIPQIVAVPTEIPVEV
ncbi:MAG: hypothetical protein P1Q69_19820, partial [Candidatus Thorarchaeota archaeon]|nr:hypothetical protein [Candidatus Thorarchaeota archaeon]